MADEQNWARNVTLAATHIRRPGSLDELRATVAGAAKIRAIGTRHSFNTILDSAGELVELGAMPAEIEIDRTAMQVAVAAGTRYAVLAMYLHSQGFALHNLASLPHISVAGAIATGTHGSGDKNGPLASAVAALELVCHDGSLVRIARGDADFEAVVVGLGAFGIVHRIVLEIGKTFDVRQDAFVALPWERLLADFDAISASAYSISVMTKWGGAAADRIWLKTRLGEEMAIGHLGLEPGSPFEVAPVEADDPAGRHTPFGGVPGPWSERLAHFRPEALPGSVDQIQSEYIIPRPMLAEAVGVLRGMADRVDPVLRTAEIRTMAADAFWLSPAYQRDGIGLHFTWHKQPDAVDAVTREIEAALLPLGGRPHWGKVIHSEAAALAPLYPRLAEFCARAAQYDPRGKFRNAFLERHVFG